MTPATFPARRRWRAVAAVLAAAMISAAPSAHGARGGPNEPNEPNDPLEPVNRVSHRVGLFADRALLRPAAKAYRAVTPRFVERGIANFLDNLTYPNVVLNGFLQGKFGQGIEDSMRFVVNTTFGLGGFIDFASAVGLERHDEDFGQTLAKWGMKEVAYLDLAALGPSSVRDVMDVPVSARMSLVSLANVNGLALPITVLRAVSARAEADEAIEFRNRNAVDTYVFTREAYRRQREHLIFDGDPPDDEDVFGIAPDRRREHLLSLLDDAESMGLDGPPGFGPPLHR